jgi:hypothetical protein
MIMKTLKYIALSCALLLGMSSCTDWLDVNTDPSSPNNNTALISNRLPWIQHFYLYSAGVTNFRTACQAGVYYSSSANPNSLSVTWACAPGNTTTPYQTWFVGAATNLSDLYESAQKEGAYHYMAVADVIHAMGFMEMLDLYGEIPYTQALTKGVISPAYDDGKTIYTGCIAKLDEAISLFSKAQAAGATSLSVGDMWNKGDVSKWIKLCYGLKARYLLKLSKKSTFDAQAILDCLDKGPQSNADNTVISCYNSSTDVGDYLWGDPVMTNGNWDYTAYGSTQRISQYYYNLLTNMRGAGIADPRMSKIVPACMTNIKLDENGKVSSYTWTRSQPVDFYGASTRLVKGGATSITAPTYASKNVSIIYTIADATARANFIAGLVGKHTYSVSDTKVTVTYQKGSIYVNSTNYIYAGDTMYVNMRNNAYLTGNSSLSTLDMNWYYSTDAMTAGAVGSTGSFQVRPNSDQEVLTYHEMCFIRAEVLMRKNNGATQAALDAYKAGIKAHMDMMQAKLTAWKSAGHTNPDMWPMDASAMTSYLSSSAVCQNPGSLTMADIMLQKYLAMGCSLENWNDMRRFNFSAGNVGSFGVVYPNYDRGPLFAGGSQLTGASKTDSKYWMRRWMLPASLELNYNSANAKAMNIHAGDQNVWCLPIWWDCATDDEYNGYIKK